MCIGIPMQVVAADAGMASALCLPWPATQDGPARVVDIRLVDNVKVGQWLLVFLGAARECLTEERANQVGQALTALQQLQSGELPVTTDGAGVSEWFADLDREPQLPEHLQAQLLAAQPPSKPQRPSASQPQIQAHDDKPVAVCGTELGVSEADINHCQKGIL